MNNNDLIRRLRYTFDYSDKKMLEIFKHVGVDVKMEDLHNWMRKEDDPKRVMMTDVPMSNFLNGFIIEKRGKRNDEIPKPEKRLNNNIILRKLKIAMNYKDSDMLEIFDLVDMIVSKGELSALFRKPDSDKYRTCKDQFLRNFVRGMQVKYRDAKKS